MEEKKEHWPDILTEHEEYEMRVLEQEQAAYMEAGP